MFTRGYVLLILLDASILTLPVLSVVVLSDTSTILRTYHGCFLRPYGGFLKWGCPQIINFFIGFPIINHPAIADSPYIPISMQQLSSSTVIEVAASLQHPAAQVLQ